MALNPSKLLEGISARNFRRLLKVFPAMRNTGVRVKRISDDWLTWDMELPLKPLKSLNYVGTHWGGTLYSSIDSQFMLAFIHILGPDYIVWDKAAAIRFKRPGKGTLHGTMRIEPEEVAEIRAACETARSVDRKFHFQWLAEDGTIVAEVDKLLYFRKKPESPE